MGRAMLILVSDDQALAQSVKSFAAGQGVTAQVYSSSDWQHRINDPNFRNQMSAGNALASGTSPVVEGAKILPFPGSGGSTTGGQSDQKVKTINELESVAIENAINEFNGNLTEAAKALGIGRATLYRKVKQYNIDPSMARRKRAA